MRYVILFFILLFPKATAEADTVLNNSVWNNTIILSTNISSPSLTFLGSNLQFLGNNLTFLGD